MQTIDNYNFKNKKALIRVDFNVPLNEKFEITDDTRMRAAVPTIKKVLAGGGSVILMSHLGRPKNGPEDKFSLKHIQKHLEELLGTPVQFADDCIGESAVKAAADLKPGEVLLLENLRFYKEEEKGDENFAHKLASLADVWINDAFGTAHRAHASTAVIAKFFPNDKLFGYVMQGELESVDKVMHNPTRPFTAIMGGSKVSSKIDIIMNLMDKVDNLIIGGGMGYTFIKAQGGKIGESLHEDDLMPEALNVIEEAKKKGVNLSLSVATVAANEFSNDAERKVVDIYNIPDGWEGMDASEESLENWKKIILSSKTILWNGPVGVFEFDNFAHGTGEIAKYVAQATQENGAYSLVGGGDSVAAVNKFGLADKVSYVSTGGGAMLEAIEGKVLPGVAAITGEK